MSTTPIHLGPALFQFGSQGKWITHASTAWKNVGVRAEDTLCIDAQGRICSIGRDFRVAHEDGSFPVTVYLKRSDLPQYEHFNPKPAEPGTERDTRTIDMFSEDA